MDLGAIRCKIERFVVIVRFKFRVLVLAVLDFWVCNQNLSFVVYLVITSGLPTNECGDEPDKTLRLYS
jgi:hypothetical protein